MGETTLDKAGLINDGIRLALSMLDRPFFWLLTILYQLFFNVASVELFSDTIMKFFSRVQVIIGVYMMFQLAVTILRGIVDPDSFMKNQGGAKGLVPRIIISLAMLAVIVPVRTSGSNEFEAQINNQGLLFGTLNSLQHRIISNNTIGRLVLGTNDSSSNFVNPTTANDSEELETSARIFASTVLKGFYRINLIPEEDRDESDNPDNKPADQVNAYRMCKSISKDIINPEPPYGKYNRIDADPGTIIGLINETCVSDYESGAFSTGTKRYVFTHIPVISFITAGAFCFILLSFTIDVAVRMIKLAALRLIAPIPIISYMDPNGSKDGAFSTWWKTLLSTYLDLFVRLAVIYFVIFLIQDMIVNGIVVNRLDGVLGVFTTIAVFIGLFAFAKQAPKFFREILGLKGEGNSFFSGFGAIGSAAGFGAASVGILGSFNASREASRLADVTNHGEEASRSLINRGKHLLAGIGGGFIGGATGMSTWFGSKDHEARAVMDAIQKRNASVVEKGATGSTFFGRAGATIIRSVQGDGATMHDVETRNIATDKSIDTAGKDFLSYLQGKGASDGATMNASAAYKGLRVTGTVDDFRKAKAMAEARLKNGDPNGGRFDWQGATFDVSEADTTKFEEELILAAGSAWAKGQEARGQNADAGYTQKRDTFVEAGGNYTSIIGSNDPNVYMDAALSVKKQHKAAGGRALRHESDKGYKRRQADFNAAKKG